MAELSLACVRENMTSYDACRMMTPIFDTLWAWLEAFDPHQALYLGATVCFDIATCTVSSAESEWLETKRHSIVLQGTQ